MTLPELQQSATTDPSPPAGSTPEVQTLWLIQANRWDEAHQLAQDLHTPTGSWLHALLHLMEGDIGNAGYWFSRAGKPAVPASEIEAEWTRIAQSVLAKG